MLEELKDRRLAAECRAVEEGHRARKLRGKAFFVKSDTTDVSYTVDARPVGEVWHLVCDCPAGSFGTLCKHSQLVARRLEREGTAVLRAGIWVDPDYWATPLPEDPFEELERFTPCPQP